MRAVEEEVVIRRPVADVFAYVTTPDHWPAWSSTVVEVQKAEAGPLRRHEQFTVVAKLVGRTFDTTATVTDIQPNRLLAYTSSSGPLPSTFTWRFEETPDGTRLVERAEADEDHVRVFFKLAFPLVERIFRRQMTADLATLGDLLEASS